MLLGLGERTVWKLSAAGQLPKPVRMGRTTRWRRADLEAFLQAGSMSAWRRARRG